MKGISFLIVFLVFVQSYGQTEGYPKDFGMPVDIPLLLAGNFGELRPGHYHAGIDIKTMNVEGKNVYSIGDGEIVRIGVSKSGYGKVLYIRHGNGYTSVYGHLQRFEDRIQDWVKKKQYDYKRSEVELFPSKGELMVRKGELVAKSGNTGGSHGAHLHFEIRDTKSGASLNPFNFGYEVRDQEYPRVYGLYGYSADGSGVVEGVIGKAKINISKENDSLYVADRVYALGKIGFGIQSVDKMTGTNNVYGLYRATIFENGVEKMSYRFDKMDPEQDEMLNSHIDYDMYVNEGVRVQKLYREKYNNTSIYRAGDGILDIKKGYEYNVVMILEDYKGNKVRVEIPVSGREDAVMEDQRYKGGEILKNDRENMYSMGKYVLSFDSESFYEDVRVDISNDGDTLRIKPKGYAMRKSFEIQAKEEEDISKCYIGKVNEKTGKVYALRTRTKDGHLRARSKSFGSFVVSKDTVVPVIKRVNISQGKNKIGGKDKIILSIGDTLTGISGYKATINGKWALMEYDPKKNKIFFETEDIDKYLGISDSNLEMIMEVWDGVGNKSEMRIELER